MVPKLLLSEIGLFPTLQIFLSPICFCIASTLERITTLYNDLSLSSTVFSCQNRYFAIFESNVLAQNSQYNYLVPVTTSTHKQ